MHEKNVSTSLVYLVSMSKANSDNANIVPLSTTF